MVRLFPSKWEPREISDRSPDLDIQKNRIKWLSKYGIERSEWTDDLPRLANLIRHGTDRIVLSMEKHISQMDDIQKEHTLSSRSAENIKRFQEAFLSIQKTHRSMKSAQSDREYIVQHLKLSESMQWIFTELKKESIALRKELERMPKNTLSERLTLNQGIVELDGLFKAIKDICTRATKIISIATLSMSIATAGTPQKIDSIASSTQDGTRFAMEHSSLVSGQMGSILKTAPDSGMFFQKLRDTPQMIGMIPEMKPEILIPLLKSDTFDGKKYQGAWQIWNSQIVQKLFPRISNITPENAETFVHALQSHLGFTKTDGKFWPKTKARLIGYFSKIHKSTRASVNKTNFEANSKAKQYPNDAPLKSEEDFRERYASFMETLGKQLQIGGREDIWGSLMISITAKESTYGQHLKSKTGSTGIMQLTKWPFADMKGETKKIQKNNREFSKRFDQAKVKTYQKIFQRLDLEVLRKIPYGNTGETFETTLSENIWAALTRIQNGTPLIVSNAIEELEQYEKGATKHNYLHSLNIILWGVYVTYIGDTQLEKGEKASIWIEKAILAIAKRYNSDSNQKIRNAYAQGVLSQYRKEMRLKA